MAGIIDLSHTIDSGMPIYLGDPEVRLAASAQDDPWRVLSLALGSHSGTHIDAARHYLREGRTIDDYPIGRFVVPGVVARVGGVADQEIGGAALTDALALAPPGGAVLLETDWDRHWGDQAMLRHPFLGVEACERLVAAGVTLVATDAFSVDSSTQGTTHAHEILLGHDVLIVENLTNLAVLDAGQVLRCAFVPLKLAAGDGSPIRAYAWTSDDDEVTAGS
jgi:kynurenine formamidase